MIQVGMLALLLLLPATAGADDKSQDKAKPPPADQEKAKDEAQPDKPKGPADEYKAMQAEHNKKQQQIILDFGKAKDEAGRKQVLERYRAGNREYAAKVLAFVEKHPKEDFAGGALFEVVSRSPESAEADKAVRRLLSDYPKEARQLGMAARQLADPENPRAESQLQAILDKGPNKEVKGQACFGLGQLYKLKAEPKADYRMADVQKDYQQAEKYLDQVTAEFGDVKDFRGGTLADAAKKMLDEIRHYGIGKTVPEAQGEDTDGKKFKLSDYRGKVVLLDFWGNW